ERVLRHFTWARAAEGTVARYREAIGRRPSGTSTPGTPSATNTPSAQSAPGAAPAGQKPAPAPAPTSTTSDTGVYPESRATC
ncbi:glycosyltransferase family 1 protein, partial [Streptomyces rubrogriseus]|nr:glycosyltransferase family 1 protein [Streptomyces rubrogriseus]